MLAQCRVPVTRRKAAPSFTHRSGVSFSKHPGCSYSPRGPQRREGRAGVCRTVRRGCRPTVGPAPTPIPPPLTSAGAPALSPSLFSAFRHQQHQRACRSPARTPRLCFGPVFAHCLCDFAAPDLVNASLSVKTQSGSASLLEVLLSTPNVGEGPLFFAPITLWAPSLLLGCYF